MREYGIQAEPSMGRGYHPGDAPMKTRVLRLICCAFALGAFTSALVAQQPPKPGPEHDMLKKFEGDWDAAAKFGDQESKGTATYKMGLGGLWLLVDYKGDFGGMKFEGKGTVGYDPMKKKYVTSWVDSMSPTHMIMEGAFDKEGKTYTETGEGPGMDGKPQKMKSTYEFKDNDTILFIMSSVAEGKDQEMFRITYTRKK
jgi:hypothetical protein